MVEFHKIKLYSLQSYFLLENMIKMNIGNYVLQNYVHKYWWKLLFFPLLDQKCHNVSDVSQKRYTVNMAFINVTMWQKWYY